jgi:hypothetical protein
MNGSQFQRAGLRIWRLAAGLSQIVELNGHQITDLTICDITIAIPRDAENIRPLARIGDARPRRIEHLGEGRP